MSSNIPEPWATAMHNADIPSYRQLAGKAGLSIGTVHMALTGQRQSVSPATIAGLAKALRLPEETISEYLGMGRQSITPYTPPQEAAMLTRRERDHVDELIRLLVASRAARSSVREMHMEDVRDDITRAEAAEDWTEEDQLAAENSADYQNYLAQADAKREQFERGDDWDLAAKQHRDPSEGAN
ncbi:helix-turn-helix transcriptional regulator [Trueperella pyogenes]|uniref:helix-turn-helix domain-containing protein n=1 Tax=Trueperella pyogenes TaxID=1661 RepID=UPI00324446B8